jgi:hypothetical protein
MASRARWLFLLYLSTVYVVAREKRDRLFSLMAENDETKLKRRPVCITTSFELRLFVAAKKVVVTPYPLLLSSPHSL